MNRLAKHSHSAGHAHEKGHDHEHCIETILLRGSVDAVRHFADSLCAERGVYHGKLNLIGVHAHQAHTHAHDHSSAPHLHLKPRA